MIIPFAAGGGTDVVARIVAKHLSDRLGQQVYVENRAGANGIIGIQALLQANPDGYTIAAVGDGTLYMMPVAASETVIARVAIKVAAATRMVLIAFPLWMRLRMA